MKGLEGFSGESLEQEEEGEYVYIDHARDEEQIIFRCHARSVEEADQKFQEETGRDPNDTYIGRVVEAEVNEEWLKKHPL